MFGGHYRTIQPFLARNLRPRRRPITERFECEVPDPVVGPVVVTGRLLRRSRQHLIVAVHGLGGAAGSGYMADVLCAADDRGASCLLLNCRGADLSGVDLYHAGLTNDLAHVLRSKQLQTFDAIDLFGYSLGGHILLRFGCEVEDERVRRIAAICSPIDLSKSADDFDAPTFSVYRRHVLEQLHACYTVNFQQRPVGLLPTEVRKINKIRDWDHRVVAPRFGFQSAEHYYSTQSAAPRLKELRREAIYVGALHDPMVRAVSVRDTLEKSPVFCVWEERAGHIGFLPDFDLGLPGPRGLESQILSWLAR